MVQRWTFHDATIPETVTLPLNPRGGGTPNRSRRVNEMPTTSPDGTPIIFEGSRPAKRIEFEGVVLTQAHFDLLDDWADRNVAVKITDDLSRVYWVKFENIDWTRVRSAVHPWKHSYTARAFVLREGA